MATRRSRPTQPLPKSSSLSSYLPLSPSAASSSTLSYFPPFVPSEPVPQVPVEQGHRRGKSLSAIAGWRLGLGFSLGSGTPESTESQEVERPQTRVQALSSPLRQSHHASSSTGHVLQPLTEGHGHKRSQGPRATDRCWAKRPTSDEERECERDRDRRRGMELLLGVMGSSANSSEESLVECVLGDKAPNNPLRGFYRDSNSHQRSKSSTSSMFTPSVRSPSRTPFRPSSTLAHPGLRRANSVRTPTQPPSSLEPLPQLKQRKTKPPPRLSLSPPSWSRPAPSPPITSLSPSLPNELFDLTVENPVTPSSTCHSERTVSETETLRPSRAFRPQPRPPPVETSSESESEDGVLVTPCLNSSPVMALFQLPATTKKGSRPVRDGLRAPWR